MASCFYAAPANQTAAGSLEFLSTLAVHLSPTRSPPSPLSPRSDSVNRRHVGQIQPAIRAHCRCRSQHRNPPVHAPSTAASPVEPCPTDVFILQRAASSSAGAESSQWATTATASAATVFAVGSAAWYYYQFGREAHAMTPAEEGLHATKYPWEHEKLYKTFDHQALRRGFQVYQEVCASCHSLKRIAYRNLVGNFMTVDEAKALAEENEFDTEPNDEGEIEKRPGKLSDYLPSPYKNDEAARAANNGALPPDLSLMVKARHGGCNYIFSLLTGYPEEPPAGAVVQEGLNFNPYFPGTGIAMARVLYDGLVEYDDKTPATTSQMAKDVVEFLNWTAEPEMDDRKKMGWKVMAVAGTLFALSVWVKRYKWTVVKTRKLVYNPPTTKAIRNPSSPRTEVHTEGQGFLK
ncbi:hypothetical protein E4T48_08343 [Aureobasidium sp. EXF-10727]|nr:hypothetical protein E4T48_08343 [Aureobasidium sp. EXF-10727]